MTEAAWFKSSYSNDTGGSCVEIAGLTTHVGIRDSKDKTGPKLLVSASAWSAFLGLVGAGDEQDGAAGQ
ncbi:DUF397 domain-containing protein [Streptomyces sp. NPDC003077]|uniref:DUF397 domain-containing protein n=1 Tax=Streptomyces sp. NPDC003077 TaxID=3154443 RepID=UPI0033B06226